MRRRALALAGTTSNAAPFASVCVLGSAAPFRGSANQFSFTFSSGLPSTASLTSSTSVGAAVNRIGGNRQFSPSHNSGSSMTRSR